MIENLSDSLLAYNWHHSCWLLRWLHCIRLCLLCKIHANSEKEIYNSWNNFKSNNTEFLLVWIDEVMKAKHWKLNKTSILCFVNKSFKIKIIDLFLNLDSDNEYLRLKITKWPFKVIKSTIMIKMLAIWHQFKDSFFKWKKNWYIYIASYT